ncbi:hypothetical protein L210DRAFT_945957 [Boletus edulis BED1]|uniref:Uncharacterized protein n=1 Tax=Boletus edulis BED1 TaxID=1328754 RepID=A0AAD4BAR9_BOLED|nr:hypothetical protein L210DRAFT_945957 [Boletus edulis BED1]
MMYAAVAYTLRNVSKEQGHESFTRFDPSNPIHVPVMMVSSARGHNDFKLDDGLIGFKCGGISRNENLRVQLMNVAPYRKSPRW